MDVPPSFEIPRNPFGGESLIAVRIFDLQKVFEAVGL
jgi:hypothetical protein